MPVKHKAGILDLHFLIPAYKVLLVTIRLSGGFILTALLLAIVLLNEY